MAKKETNEKCSWQKCQAKGYLDDDSEEYYCPNHYLASSWEILDADLRDYLPMKSAKTARDMVRGFFLKMESEYKPFKNLRKSK